MTLNGISLFSGCGAYGLKCCGGAGANGCCPFLTELPVFGLESVGLWGPYGLGYPGCCCWCCKGAGASARVPYCGPNGGGPENGYPPDGSAARGEYWSIIGCGGGAEAYMNNGEGAVRGGGP
jgi:hypothetical protein